MIHFYFPEGIAMTKYMFIVTGLDVQFFDTRKGGEIDGA